MEDFDDEMEEETVEDTDVQRLFNELQINRMSVPSTVDPNLELKAEFENSVEWKKLNLTKAQTKQGEMDIRRRKVNFLRRQGITQIEIAARLGIHVNTVKKDIKFISNDNRQRVVQAEGFAAAGDAIAELEFIAQAALHDYQCCDPKNPQRTNLLTLSLKARQEVINLQDKMGLLPKVGISEMSKSFNEISKMTDEELKKLKKELLSQLEGSEPQEEIKSEPTSP